MKFLSWMHRKLTQNGTELNRNSKIGLNVKCQKPLTGSQANKADVFFQEELFESFDFLAIGTFGKELHSTPFENLTNPSETTENDDLMFINYELEKFLEAEEKENANDTSEKSSQASIITLSHKPTEGADSEGHMYTLTCPLQNYLFATPIEHTETYEDVKKEKGSHHDEKQPMKRNAAHFMKKVVKKFNSSSSVSKACSKNEAEVTISIKKKLSKAVKMFHRKVHPEEMTDKQFKLQKSDKKHTFNENDRHIRGYNENKITTKLSSNGTHGHASTINEGHWIKTDSDLNGAVSGNAIIVVGSALQVMRVADNALRFCQGKATSPLLHKRLVHPKFKILLKCNLRQGYNPELYLNNIRGAYNPNTRVLTLNEIRGAVQNLPKGEFVQKGFVSKGKLNGEVVAIKWLSSRISSPYEINVRLLSRLNHPNIIKLVGYCAEGAEKIIVYEFMPNWSLYDQLQGEKTLAWDKRMKIAHDVAKALKYLHYEAHPPVIYGDLKPSNILLDELFNAKLSDFGEAQSSLGVKNSPCPYWAPERSLSGRLSLKSDVYNFGVIMFEILFGKHKELKMLKDMSENELSTAVKSHLEEDIDSDTILKAIKVVSMCVSELNLRPNMRDVVRAMDHLTYDPRIAKGRLPEWPQEFTGRIR
ncbi:hypothetical protein CASFOL_003548 [Castilleja foliolosa]|uniref:Protein kinase domain-containing protein n=1 Tax=Castilleja foliolosa TaxID=1961234 RepID=A0ABD3EHH7_9LAMI